MPLTNDLENYQGADLFSTVTQRTFNLASNYIELDGCPDTIVDASTTGFI